VLETVGPQEYPAAAVANVTETVTADPHSWEPIPHHAHAG
jgi:hypothetical protein